jgi:hypothetical protein
MKHLRLLTGIVIVIFSVVGFVSSSRSLENIKAPAMPVPATKMSAPPFHLSIKVNSSSARYLDPIHLSAEIISNYPQKARDEIAGKTMEFYIDGRLVGSDICQENSKDIKSNPKFLLSVPENYARQLNLQVGKHEIIAQIKYANQLIKGYNSLTIAKAASNIVDLHFVPDKSTGFVVGETLTISGMLKTDLHYPIAHTNVACISLDATQSVKKTLFTVKTNNQGGFECPILLTPDVFERQNCNLHYGFFSVSFLGNQHFAEASAKDHAILACSAGMRYMKYSTHCPSGCDSCCK